MGSVDFQSLQPQLHDQLRAIELAEPSERRVLMIELAKVLAAWEATRNEPLTWTEELARTGHWSDLALAAGAESRRLAVRLGEAKPALCRRLQEVGLLIEAAEVELQPLTSEVEALRDKLSLSDAHLADLIAREVALRQQLEAAQRLQALQSEVAEAQAKLGLLGDTLQRGDKPSEILAGLASLRDAVLGYYGAYLEATRNISDQLTGDGEVTATPSNALLEIPARLLALDRELESIDDVLSGHLRRQEALDLEIKARV